MNSRVILTITFVGLGLILAAIPQNTTHPYKLTAKQMLEESNNMDMYYTPDEVAQKMVQKDPLIQLIDVRSPDEFDKFSLPDAINIPLTELLNEQNLEILDQDIVHNIFYSNGTTDALKAWMIARQLGWENNFVLQGGLNYWAETIMNPLPPANTNPNEEIAKYEFRMGAAQALGASVEKTPETGIQLAPKPVVKKSSGKKKVQGGC